MPINTIKDNRNSQILYVYMARNCNAITTVEGVTLMCHGRATVQTKSILRLRTDF